MNTQTDTRQRGFVGPAPQWETRRERRLRCPLTDEEAQEQAWDDADEYRNEPNG